MTAANQLTIHVGEPNWKPLESSPLTSAQTSCTWAKRERSNSTSIAGPSDTSTSVGTPRASTVTATESMSRSHKQRHSIMCVAELNRKEHYRGERC